MKNIYSFRTLQRTCVLPLEILVVYCKNYTIWTKSIYLMVYTSAVRLKATNHTRMATPLAESGRYN